MALLREPRNTQDGQQDIHNQSDTKNDRRNRGHFDVEICLRSKDIVPSEARPQGPVPVGLVVSRARSGQSQRVDRAAAEPT